MGTQKAEPIVIDSIFILRIENRNRDLSVSQTKNRESELSLEGPDKNQNKESLNFLRVYSFDKRIV